MRHYYNDDLEGTFRNERGPRTVEERYLKNTHWSNSTTGYYVTLNQNDYAVEFFPDIFCWVYIRWDHQRSAWCICGPALSDWGLDIYIEETPYKPPSLSTHRAPSPSLSSHTDKEVAETSTRLEGLVVKSDEGKDPTVPLDIVIPLTDAADKEEGLLAGVIDRVNIPVTLLPKHPELWVTG
jgi:hypothetical protein